jgi:hypothetical protein
MNIPPLLNRILISRQIDKSANNVSEKFRVGFLQNWSKLTSFYLLILE